MAYYPPFRTSSEHISSTFLSAKSCMQRQARPASGLFQSTTSQHITKHPRQAVKRSRDLGSQHLSFREILQSSSGLTSFRPLSINDQPGHSETPKASRQTKSQSQKPRRSSTFSSDTDVSTNSTCSIDGQTASHSDTHQEQSRVRISRWNRVRS